MPKAPGANREDVAHREPMASTVKWAEVPASTAPFALRGLATGLVVGGSLVLLALMGTDRWDEPGGGNPAIAMLASLAGMAGLAAAMIADRLRGWGIAIALYALLVAGFLFLIIDDENDSDIDNAVKIAMGFVGAALAAWVLPQAVAMLAALRDRVMPPAAGDDAP